MIRTRWYIILFFSSFVMLSCSTKDSKSELLIGDWTLRSAVRQGRPTSTLNGLRFTFTDDSVFTNLPVFENHNYSYSNDTLTILASDPYVFHVFHVDSSKLDLDGEIRQVRFRLNFERILP